MGKEKKKALASNNTTAAILERQVQEAGAPQKQDYEG